MLFADILPNSGWIAAKGTAKAHELMRLAGDDERLPPMAREALGYIVAQIRDIEGRLKIFEQRILSLAKEDEVCRRLMTMRSIVPHIATAIAATVGDPRNFASGRHFAAWLGLTPKQHSTGGKEKLGGRSCHENLALAERRFRRARLEFGPLSLPANSATRHL
jgi:transposase